LAIINIHLDGLSRHNFLYFTILEKGREFKYKNNSDREVIQVDKGNSDREEEFRQRGGVIFLDGFIYKLPHPLGFKKEGGIYVLRFDITIHS